MYPIAIKCQSDGFPIDPFTDYWQIPNVVNPMSSPEEYKALSMAGRYGNPSPEEFLLTYNDVTYSNDILNKLVIGSITEFKSSGLSTTNLDRSEPNTQYVFRIFDIKGNNVLRFEGTKSDLIDFTNEKGMASAIYFVKAISLDGKYSYSQKIFLN